MSFAESPKRGTKRRPIDLTADDNDDNEESSQTPSKMLKSSKKLSTSKQRPKKKEAAGEKRLRKFRDHPPQSFEQIRERALTQRLCVLERKRGGTAEEPEETVHIAGTTGNIYQIVINKVPSCNCPHALKGNQCKHIIYVLNRTLKAPSNLQYQLAFLTSELTEIFNNAPPIPSERADANDTSGKRKPLDDDCPICCVEFDIQNDEIVWCKAACGNNVHKQCFETWAAQKRGSGSGVTCPFCRTPWQENDAELKKFLKGRVDISDEGYMNVAGQLGLSGLRDYSSYHRPWVRRQRRGGYIYDEDFNDDEYEY